MFFPCMPYKSAIFSISGTRKYRASLLALWFAVSCMPTVARATADLADSTLYALVAEDSWLNVRERPTPGAAVVLRLTRGDAVSLCTLRADGWACIDRAGDPGYCRIEYLTDTPPADPVSAQTVLPQVRVRALPGGKALAKLRKGAQVSVCGWVSDAQGVRWANIGDGFIRADCLAVMP
jgi:uncharacterized protein YgiM (DUF1202 family)